MFDRIVRGFKRLVKPHHPEVNKEPRVISPDEHGIDLSLVSKEAKRTCEALHDRHFEAYIVGGAVRDLLLGVKPKDFDVVTDATPSEVKRSQRRAVIIGKRFRLVHVMFGDEIIECSTFRALDSDGVRKDSSGRVVSDNVFGEMWEDAARRDFTVNALYFDPQTLCVYDYHNGFEDIAAKRIRMIGDPATRYREDPVRMLRAVRIATKLGFKIDPQTEKPIRKMASLLRNVPTPRLNDELLKILMSGHAVACIQKLRELGLDSAMMPMLNAVLSEEDGERFLMCALERTDERLRMGKSSSPFFLFATLLWPQVVRRWRYYEFVRGESHLQAIHSAASAVLATQCAQLSIHRRIQHDMYEVWLMQARLERRTGKNPYNVIRHPRYRAGYDFLLLRAATGHVDASLPQWWDRFAYAADDDERRELIQQMENLARRQPVGDTKSEHKKRAIESAKGIDFEAEVAVVEQRKRRQNGSVLAPLYPEGRRGPAPRRRRASRASYGRNSRSDSHKTPRS